LKGPAIIISASGMMQAGRVKHHLLHNVEDPKNTILVVGYTAKGTLGTAIRNRAPEIRIFGACRKLRANVEIMDSFSAHADHNEIIAFLEKQDKNRLQKVFLVHGEIERQIILKEDLLVKGFKEVVIPEYGNTFDLT
jgi:metallo-beta-lactamase family protein